eukprot:GGOE01041065.1.p1 GENE.GGOE01041065.1~~GGOE01041065.1.p1  ORF type:complete len:196 (+),score=20.17 GGOE01041065.1:69-656(+)
MRQKRPRQADEGRGLDNGEGRKACCASQRGPERKGGPALGRSGGGCTPTAGCRGTSQQGIDACQFEAQQCPPADPTTVGPRLLRVNRRQDRFGARKEKKAERAARLERTIASELAGRILDGVYDSQVAMPDCSVRDLFDQLLEEDGDGDALAIPLVAELEALKKPMPSAAKPMVQAAPALEMVHEWEACMENGGR